MLACALTLAAALASEARAESAPSQDPDPSFWSRVTLVVPVYTRHFPDNAVFDDHNWGAIVNVAIDRHWSVVGGDYENSFRHQLLFAGVSYSPVSFQMGKLRVSPGVMMGVDLNNGYGRHDPAEPLLGALELHVTGEGLEGTRFRLLGRTGVALTLMPGGFNQRGAVPVNVALTYRFGP